ncbi:R3H and coiled-coil domain-containing protein 1-like [Hibiscus syriacus]|uniref:R3H and coiled-coil domain-containing protein 1-like n=1 Tax=Hibiscus syriacus TaxID=106335 RepID=UPI001923ECF7|nr:R3H and coiled-coil domain-containing protein 1-like [Hibiscus syriacus]
MSAPEDTENEDLGKHPETKRWNVSLCLKIPYFVSTNVLYLYKIGLEILLNAAKYGTHHVLVLADFSPSTRTQDLEKLFENFRDRGVSIRWVNDTTALAVFRTPSIALEALNYVCCPFTVRILDKDDALLGSISARDLEPPRQRSQTSARTAQRMIAQAIGSKFTSTFGSRELRNQEEARRNRITTRQKLRDDAWGDD